MPNGAAVRNTDDISAGGETGTGFQDFITYRMARVQAQLNAQAGAVLRAHGDLTPARWRILSLMATGAPTRLMEICRLTGMDKGQVSRNLSRLVAAGLLSSQRDTSDLRAQKLDITAEGQATFEQIFPVMRARHDFLLSQLEGDQLGALREALDVLEAAAAKRDF